MISTNGRNLSRATWGRRTLRSVAIIAAPVAAMALTGTAVFAQGASFVNTTTATGIEYIHAAPGGPVAPAKGHGGLAVVDVDGDGWPDLLGARLNATPVLYVNQRNGTFVEEAVARGLGSAVNASSFVMADFENKGRQDIFVVPEKGPRFFYFVNDGTGHFAEDALARGASVPTTLEDHQAFSVSVVDYDRDGYLDIYVCEWGPTSEFPLHSVLLHNLGAKSPGHFENVTVFAGLLQSPALKSFYVNPAGKPQQTAFSAAWADFDGDGWPDLALVGDFGTSRLYWNNGNGTFTEGAQAAGLGLDEFGMGVAVADFDGDGRLDLFVSSIFDQPIFSRLGTNTGNKLYRNLGNRRFAEVSKSTGVDRSGWSWGAAFFDYNNRGVMDLVVTNGVDGVSSGIPGGFYNDALTDQTALFRNDGRGGFTNFASTEGITDTGLGKGVVVWDYDNDGSLDLAIADTYAGPVVYRNTVAIRNDWIRLKFRGTTSNRDGVGAVARITAGGRTQTLLYHPTNAFLGSHEPVLHAGLGSPGAVIEKVEITWPSGTVQTLTNVPSRQILTIVEPAAVLSKPLIVQQPTIAGRIPKDAPLVLTVTAAGQPAPVYAWQKDGVTIPGANQPTLSIARIHPFDAGRYTALATNSEGTVASVAVDVVVTVDLAAHSAARWWNEFLLDGIRKDTPNPPVHARNLYHLSAAMWDAFWAYEIEGWSGATPVFVQETVRPADWLGGRESAQRQAISYAAYRVLTQRFKNSPGAARTLFGLRWLMQQFGYDPDFTGTTGNAPAAVGNRIGFGVLAATLNDGANEANGYADATGYKSLNDPMPVARPGTTMADPSRWQPLALTQSITQNGIPLPNNVQSFVGVNARNTTPFATIKPTPTTSSLDPGPPPQFGGATHAAFVQQALDCLQLSAMLDPSDGVSIDISPGAYLNNPLGSNVGTGRALNPFTNRPYPSNVVKRGDYARVLAEYWADGPNSETPPGHWNVILNEVTDHPSFVRRYGGVGSVLPALEWDVRAYLALNGAAHDAACTAWLLKRQYDSARPISVIRYLAGLGQSSEPSGPSYQARGLPLVPGLIEVITAASSAVGQRHAHLADSVGQLAIRAWQGNPSDVKTQIGGVGWILAAKWVPYQMSTFVTPAFPGYVSGHSTFSRAAAEVLTLLTGSPFFPGGLGEKRFAANSFLEFERGPSADLSLQWATYYDAADQAGLSRLFGGIHPAVDDLVGRRLGARVGLAAFLKAQTLRQGLAPTNRGLINLSSRGRAGTGDDTLIAGFVIDGAVSQTTLLRSIGPALANFGFPAERCEPDPSLELHRSSDDAILLVNDNWSASPRAAAIAARAAGAGAFALAPGSKDAAELSDLSGGGYSMVLRSAAPAQRGIALAEVYGQQLLNLSTRGSVGRGDSVLVAGFVIDAADPLPVLVRGVGPTLTAFGVRSVLGNPTLTIYRQLGNGATEIVASNDDWSTDAKASLTQSAAQLVGAFPLTVGSRDAALFLQLPAGNYTAVVASADNAEGIALVEVYRVK